jgi:CRISPR/Cas system-associated exonuclease Cas4 (RecB family)
MPKTRVRNLFDPTATTPFKLSRSKIENFTRCARCFYLDRRLGIAQPSMPPFNLNSAVDTLFKKEFDIHRAAGKAHPLMEKYGVDAIPYADERMNEWRENFKGMQYLHKPTNFLVTGAIDDLWVNPQGELIVVDYKSTSKDEEITLDGQWKEGYKRQMEIYQWLFRQSGFAVSNTGYFVYANGRTDRKAFDGKLEFDVTLLPYTGDDSWVEDALHAAHDCLMSDELPEPNSACEYCHYRAEAAKVEL